MSLNEIDPLAESPGAQAPVEPKVARSRPAQPREPLYFVVILLLIADIVFGLGLAVFADRVMDFRPMAVGGLGLAGLGLGILAYFVLFGSGKPKQ
jgi:F0F1-type ATP synthase assembly protein I